nr:MAG TPA: hypothetical protein [Caudoviricetes sp.]
MDCRQSGERTENIMKTKIEMIEKEVNGTFILQDPDWLDDDWVIAPVNHPLPWYWDEDSDEYIDGRGVSINLDNLKPFKPAQ